MNSPYLTRFRNGEYLRYMKDVLDIVNQQDVDSLLLTTPVNRLSTSVSRINDAYQQKLGSTLTQDVIALDNRRGAAIIGIRAVVKGYSYHYNSTMANAANAILDAIAAHGSNASNITRLSYQQQTAILESLISDFETIPELIEAFITLNLNEWLVELKTANTLFIITYLERIKTSAANPSINLISLRIEATDLYRDLIKKVNAHATLSETNAYPIILNEIELLTKQYNLVVDNRTHTKPDDSDIPDTDTGSE